ncbi:S41 family peptidase [Lutimonas vermicola]|uniref:S41 family peptidase n=1 Tax=Lutimonas vermicola TaxID=414288 RepID=A0ABU9KX80_9FLAO
MIKDFSKWAFLLAFLVFVSCSDSNDIPDNPNPGTQTTLKDPVNNFIWKGMNSWYNWQLDVPNLADSKDDIQEDYINFLNGYTDYRNLMYSLSYRHISLVGAANAVDRFSWFVDDYEVQANAFQGISTRFGFTQRTIQINEAGDIVIAILLVENDSPAARAGMKRGDIVNAINGIILNTGTVDAAFAGLSNETVTLSFVSENDGVLTQLDDKTMTRAVVTANPVHVQKIFNDIGGKKVGYLLYNSFDDSWNDELNEAFAIFKAEGINELVLDFRFNGGGSGLATNYLASMIYGQGGTGLFYETKFNAKHSQYNSGEFFQNDLIIQNSNLDVIGEEPVNRLNTLDRLYVLTSGSTASASELIINGLKPYMSTVKLIGTTTYGKNVGSITLYDSPDTDFLSKDEANTAHKYAMQPICIQVFNKNGESDYTQGFQPDIEVDDTYNWNAILPFGDRNEALLKVALDDISGIAAKQTLSKYQLQAREIKMTLPEDRYDSEMYFDHLIKKQLKP